MMYERIKPLVISYNKGDISYNELKEKAQPILDDMNKKGREIAKKYGKQHKKINLQNVMRNIY